MVDPGMGFDRSREGRGRVTAWPQARPTGLDTPPARIPRASARIGLDVMSTPSRSSATMTRAASSSLACGSSVSPERRDPELTQRVSLAVIQIAACRANKPAPCLSRRQRAAASQWLGGSRMAWNVSGGRDRRRSILSFTARISLTAGDAPGSRSLTRTFTASPIRIPGEARIRTSTLARSLGWSATVHRFSGVGSPRRVTAPPRGSFDRMRRRSWLERGSIPWCGRDTSAAATRRCTVLGATVQPPIAQITSAAWSLLLGSYPVARSSSRA